MDAMSIAVRKNCLHTPETGCCQKEIQNKSITAEPNALENNSSAAGSQPELPNDSTMPQAT